jgi:hypothetical protein
MLSILKFSGIQKKKGSKIKKKGEGTISLGDSNVCFAISDEVEEANILQYILCVKNKSYYCID